MTINRRYEDGGKILQTSNQMRNTHVDPRNQLRVEKN